MGQISISVAGSFGRNNGTRTFSAMKYGHAHAVADAIAFLSGELLPAAIGLDHELHEGGDKPNAGFTKPTVTGSDGKEYAINDPKIPG